MPTESGKPLIVISYAHADEPETPAEGEVKWLSFVTGYLRPAIKHGAADLWLDRLMLGGAEWEAEIEHKLRACDVFILLVSRHSLSSDYVVDKEIALIRERQAKGEKVHFYPLILTPTPKIALDLVRDRNLRPRDGKPFSDYSVNDRYRHMNEAADEIADIANAIAANPAQPGRRQSRQESAAGPPLDPVDPVQAAEPGDQQSLQRWMRRRHPDVVLTIAARAALRVAPLVYHARQERVGAAPARELDDLLCTVLRALAPAQLAPQVFHADEFRPAFHAAADKAEAAARRAAYSTARAVCQSVSAVAAAAATRFDDQTPRAAFAAQAVTLAAEASARGAADHAALIVRELSRRTDADRVDDDVGGRRERDNATRAAATAAEGSGAAALWEEVQADLAWAEGFDPDALDADATKNRPLWAHGQPDWVRNVWSSFKAEASLAQPWDVWIAWYEERLRGVAREEAYEAVFAGVPTEEWNKGPSAANGWIRQRLGQVQTTPAITDRETLAAWLDGKAPQVAVAMAARAALRAVPLLATPKLEIAPQELESATAAVFRASALARAVARQGAWADKSSAAACRAAATAASQAAARVAPAGARVAAQTAADAARAADACARGADLVRAMAVDAASRATHWHEVQSDAATVEVVGIGALIDKPLWSASHDQTEHAWSVLPNSLPRDHGWSVWVDWYEARLRGGSRDEDYELIFASVPRDEWDKGPAAANAWIKAHLPERDDALPRIDVDVRDQASLEAWLKVAPGDVVTTLTARALLRGWIDASSRHGRPRQGRLPETLSAFLGVAALNRVAGLFPTRTIPISTDLAAQVNLTSFQGTNDTAYLKAATQAAVDAAASAIILQRYGGSGAHHAASAIQWSVDLSRLRAEDPASADAHRRLADEWARIRFEASEIAVRGVKSIAEAPLFAEHESYYAREALAELQANLPDDNDWDVWIDWYKERLHGGSRGEGYELVFASVPREAWSKGPAAANAWIKAHLPRASEPARPVELPAPLANVEAPFAYGWSASQRVAVVAGAQNLPFYPHFSSEEDHRRALETCRLGGERLLKSLRSGRYNARPEYGEALEYYLDDLPKTAGAGNILIANDQIRILHVMFLADAAMLPEGLASRLKSVIANQFALNAFYDLVERHNVAVSAGNWSKPFPLDAAKGFFGAVGDHTPRWFEPGVEKGLRQVEQAEPPPAAPIEPQPPAAVEPAPLPPGTPDAQDSWKRQMATAANALWETFLQGQSMRVAQDEWRNAADELGAHVRPILEFLQAQEPLRPAKRREGVAEGDG